MTAAEFVVHLGLRDIRLSLDGNRLRCSAPKGALTEALRDELAARKTEVVAWLRSRSGGDGAGTSPLSGEGVADEPLSFSQQRLWFIDRFQPGGAAYNITGAMRIRGRLDVGALERSLGEVVRRHEPLRTVFATVDGQPVQVLQPYQSFSLTIVSVEPSGTNRDQDVKRLMVEEGRLPFDLAEGPLFRARLFRLAADEHVLQLSMHHIVADGWSLVVLCRELTALYEKCIDGLALELPALPLRYSDIARKQRERLSGPALEAHSAYWKSRLTPLPPVLELPADFPRPAIQTFNGAVESFIVPSAHVEVLQRLGRERGVTLFMTLFAAFSVILHRHTGQTDIAIGVPIANRTDVEAEAVIGLLVNTLVLRVDFTGDPSFDELLLRVRAVALDAYAHQDFPFERLVEMLQPARDMSHPVLAQVLFIFQNLPPQVLRLPGLTLSYPAIRTGTAKVDLTLEVVEQPEGLALYLEYNTDLFRADTIRRFAGHLERLLTSIATEPAQRVSRLPLLTDLEWRRITIDWNATEIAGTAGATISRLFQEQAERTPEAVAARFETQRLSYRELDRRVNRFAHHLRRYGVGPGVLVGILLERSLDMLVTVLAVMKAGGAYVPLDPAYPRDRLEFMVRDAELPVVVSSENLLDHIPLPAGTRALCVDRDAGAIAAEPDVAPAGGAGVDDLAYVIYTSGSTGRPKGVEILHRSLANVVAAFRMTLGAGPRDTLVSVTTLSFDIAGLELFLPLVTGAHLVIAGREVAADPVRLKELMADVRPTIMQATPATWRMLVESGWERGEGLRILCGGEALAPELAARLLATGASVWNAYGPTETTIWSTVHAVDTHGGPVPIGRAIANTQTYVLGANEEPVPIGVAGELYIGGVGVARGYRNRPELTAEKFVADRFSDRPGARLYRTGDVACWRPDGTLEYLGRVDHQVKVRGFRIEPGEIESVLASHPAVAQAVVTAREDGYGGARSLAAYVRLAAPMPPSHADLRAFLQERLPDYMVPSTFTVLEHFPLTPNGKVNRQQLPEADGRGRGSGRVFLAPRSGIERSLAEVWRDVLRLEEVGVADNFFDLGGHSLLLVQVQTRLRETLGHDLAIAEMFQYPTIGTLATHLERLEAVPS